MKSALATLLLAHLSTMSMAGSIPFHLLSTSESPTSLRNRAEEGCSKEINAPIGSSVIDAAQGLGAVMAYTVGGGTLAYNACDAIALAHGQQPGRKCRIFTQSIASGILIGLTALSGSKSGQGTSTSDKRDDVFSLQELLQSLGVDHDGVYTLPVPDLSVELANSKITLNTTDHENPIIVSRYYVKGVVSDNFAMDHTVTNYDDGTGSIQVAPSLNSTASPGNIIKRHDGPGFKFNYQRFDTNTNFLGSPDLSQLPDYSNAVSLDWASRVDDDGADEYIFTGGIDHLFTFGMRIIPESLGFGEEYEDVNICGNLAPIAHDELKI